MTNIARILAALSSGAATSEEIAKRLGRQRRNVSAALCQLAALGIVERAGSVSLQRAGRPYIRWRLRLRLPEGSPLQRNSTLLARPTTPASPKHRGQSK
jgi:predicted ArsR family transcriptional regulator